MKEKAAVAIDIGATNVRLGIVDQQGKVTASENFSSSEIADQNSAASVLSRHIDKLLGAERVEKARIAGIGIGAPGPLDREQGVVEFAPNFPNWKNVALRDQLSAWSGLPVWLDNDVNAQAIGEQMFGAGRGVDTFLLASIGTGLGSGLIINGKSWEGHFGVAPELGHINIVPDGPLCGCGRRGCLEAYASGSGIVRQARERAILGASSLRNACGGDLDKLTAEMVAHAAHHHSFEGAEIFKQVGWALGIGLSIVINFFDPGLILIGGKISQSWDLFNPEMRRVLDERIFSKKARNTEIKRAERIDQAGLLGSAAIVFNNQKT